MAKLLAALALWLVPLAAMAAGSVAVIPNKTIYKAELGNIACPYLATPMASANACLAEYEKEYGGITGGNSTSHCWTRTAHSLNGPDMAPKLKRWNTVIANPNPVYGQNCTNSGVSTVAFDSAVNYTSVVRNVCPANATGNGTGTAPNHTACTCDGGYKPDALAKACIPDCTANQTVSSGWYDIGESQGASPQLLGCKGLCEVVFDGTSPAGSAMVEGKKHWYAKGEYIATGGTCPAAMADKPIGEGKPTKPEDTCAPGEAKGTVNGKAVCVKQSGEEAGKPTDESATKDKITTETKTETNPDGSVTTTETTVKIGADGKKETTIKKTTTKPDGSTSSDSETVTEWPPAGSEGGGEDGEEGEEETACQKNPSGEGCGGEPVNIGGLYSPKEKTMAGVLGAHRDAALSSPFGSAVGGFFSVNGGGSCPTWNASIPFLDADLTIDQFCSNFAQGALAILKIAILLGSSFFAFRVAVE